MAGPSLPNESAEYRTMRDGLLVAETALRDQTEQVAALRRALPPGGTLPQDFEFEERTPSGVARVRLSELFDPGRNTLLIYGFMFGPEMQSACPMCNSFLDSLNAAVPHLRQRVSLALCGQSPIERVADFGTSRGWSQLRLISSAQNDYARANHTEAEDGSQLPMANVFVRGEDCIRHFWSSELLFSPLPNGNSRHIDLLWPLWNVLDVGPEGRGDHWYPSLDYQS